MATPASTEATRLTPPITIILTGKSGAGKSTMKDTLLGNHATQKPSPDPVTKKFVDKIFTKNDINIRIIDTPGLEGKKEDEKELKMCSAFTEGKADLLVYCLTVGAGHRFHEANPEIIKYIAEGFKKQIWDHCILVLTMSNGAYSEFAEDYPDDPERAAEEYRNLLKEFADMFQEKLQKLQVYKLVKTIFELETIERDASIIIAVPAGKKADKRVLPGLRCRLPPHCDDLTWTSVLIEVMRVTCPSELAPSILQYQYGVLKPVACAAIGAAGGLGGAITVGGAIGGAVGGIAGPIGAGVGLLGGVVVGAVVGKILINKEKEDIKKEVEERQNQEESWDETLYIGEEPEGEHK